MITLPSVIAFVAGFAVVYLLFRIAGIFVFLLLCLPCYGVEVHNASTNVVIWTDTGSGAGVAFGPGSVVSVDVSGWSGIQDSISGMRGVNYSVLSGLVAADIVSIVNSGGTVSYYLAPLGGWAWVNVWQSVLMGLGCGFGVSTFGWIFRIAKQSASDF